MPNLDPRRPSANGFAGRDGYRRSGPSLAGEPGNHAADDPGTVSGDGVKPGHDGLAEGLEFRRDVHGFRDDGRAQVRDRGGSRVEPGAFRDETRGLERHRNGFGPDPNSFRYDERQLTPERANGIGVEPGPDAYRDDGRGGVTDRYGFRPSLAGEALPEPTVDHNRAQGHLVRPDEQLPEPQSSLLSRPWTPTQETPAEPDDDAVTAPLPVILHGAPSLPRPEPVAPPLPVILPGASLLPRPEAVAAPRGPFEAAQPSQPSRPLVHPVSATGSLEPPAAIEAPAFRPPAPPEARRIPASAAAKLDQLNDLYLTAEAIGEEALDKHFEQVSQRQRDLIREFFERSMPNGDAPN